MTLPPEVIAGLAKQRDRTSQARKAAENAQQHLALQEAELRGMESMVQLLNGGTTLSQPVRFEDRAVTAHVQERGELPAMRRQWKSLLAATAKTFPADLSLDDMERLSIEIGRPANRNTLRSQMSIYAGLGVVERTGSGRYRLTPHGARAVGVTLPDAPLHSSSPLLSVLDVPTGDVSGTKPIDQTQEEKG